MMLYTLRATFQADDGRKSTKTTPGLSWQSAMDQKTALLESCPWCLSASMTPERRA